MSEKILITASWCGACSEAKAMLRKRKIKFKEIDAESKKGKALADRLKIDAVPAMVVDGKNIPNPEKWFD